jgi:plastocyanin
MRRSRLWAVLAAAACMAAVGLPAAGSSAQTAQRAGTPKVIRVADDYFSPALTRVVPNRLVKWVWSMDNTNTHNVRLVTAPSGVDKSKFRSANGSIGIRFSRRLTKVGLYEFVCTFHSTVMRHKIRVRRA